MKKNEPTTAATSPENRPSGEPSECKLIVFMQGGKGGTGKTTFALQLLDFYKRNGVDPHVIDFDNENKTGAGLQFFWPEAVKVNINRRNALDAFVKGLESGADVIVADMGAGAGETAMQWMDDMAGELKESSVSFAAVGIVTDDIASVESVLSWGAELGNRVRHIIVLNQATDPRSEFTHWDSLDKAKAYREALNPEVIRMESIDPTLQGMLRVSGDTIGGVVDGTAKEPELKRMLWTMRAKGVRSRMDAGLKRILPALLP